MDGAYDCEEPVWLKQTALAVSLVAVGVAGLLWTLRHGNFANPGWWLLFALYVNLWVIALVAAKRMQRRNNDADPGGFEVLREKDE